MLGDGEPHEAVNIALMEVGHNLGMEHQDGDVNVYDGSDQYSVSPMITNLQDQWSQNSCGTDMPNRPSGYDLIYNHFYSQCALDRDGF